MNAKAEDEAQWGVNYYVAVNGKDYAAWPLSRPYRWRWQMRIALRRIRRRIPRAYGLTNQYLIT